MRLLKKQLAVLVAVCMVLSVMASLFTMTATAADTACYFLPTQQGTGSGNSWANAKALTSSALTTALASNDIAYIGSGTYSSGVNISVSGTSLTPKQVIGVDTGAGKPKFEKAAYPQNGKAFSITSGTRNLVIDNFTVSGFAYGVSTDGNSSNITIRNLDINYAIQSIALDGGGQAGDNVRLDKIIVENCNFFEYTKSGIRMLNRVNNVLIKNCVADSNGVDGYQHWYNRGLNVSSGNYWPVGFEQTGGATLKETNVTYVDCVASGSYCPTDKTSGSGKMDGYWNGDGFAGERGGENVTFIRCRAYGATDGGWDSKGTNLYLVDCIGQDNSKNFRFWGSAEMENCASIYAHSRGGSNKSMGIWISGSGTTVTVNNSTFYNNGQTGTGYAIQGTGGKATFNKCIFYSKASGKIQTGSNITKHDCKVYDGSTAAVFMNPPTARGNYFNGDSTNMNAVGDAAGYGYKFEYFATPVTPPPFVEATPAPVTLTRDTVLYEEDFEKYTSSTISQCGWTNYGSLKTNSTKYMQIGAGNGAFPTKTFAPVPLTSAGGTSPGKNVTLELEYRISRGTYNTGNWYFIGFGSSSSTGAPSMAVSAASRCDASEMASTVIFSYATTLNTGKVGSPIFLSGDNTKATSEWVTVKYVVPVTDANGNFISTIEPKAYINGQPDEYILGKLINNVDKIDKISMGTSSGGGKLNVDDIKVTLKTAVNFDESELKMAVADATALYDTLLPLVGTNVDQYKAEDVNALKGAIDVANAILTKDVSLVTQAEIDSAVDAIYTAMDNCVPISYTRGDLNNDGLINSQDVTILMQVVANWSSVTDYVPEAGDVNGDGLTNAQDVTILMQMVAGWNVD